MGLDQCQLATLHCEVIYIYLRQVVRWSLFLWPNDSFGIPQTRLLTHYTFVNGLMLVVAVHSRPIEWQLSIEDVAKAFFSFFLFVHLWRRGIERESE